MSGILITNNPSVNVKYSGSIETVYLENGDYEDVLRAARDRVHLGHKLLTHPLSGSVKPGHTPYKSVLISKEKGVLDIESLGIIEDSIRIFGSQTKVFDGRRIPEKVSADFQLIDMDLIKGGINSMNGSVK